MTIARLIHGSFGKPGSIDGADCLTAERQHRGTLVYGPYEEVGPGHYRVTFQLGGAENNATMGDPVCAVIDVATNNGLSLLAEKRLLVSDLRNGLGSVSLDFIVREPRCLEYRVHSTGQVALNVVAEVVVEPASSRNQIPRRGSPEREWSNEREFLDGFLRNISGLIHVGANLGQERRYYWLLGLDVAWVEPIIETYQQLVDNIASYDRQRAFNVLLSEADGQEYEFRIANQGAGSSSILPFKDHSTIWPDIQYVESRVIRSVMLQTLMKQEHLSTDVYQALTLDVEGAELLVLKGGGDLLKGFKYIKCEVADFPSRTGAPTSADLDAFLRSVGFAQLMRRPFAMGPNNEGTYWDIVWKRVEPNIPFHEPGYEMPMVAHPNDVAGLEKCE